MEASGGTIAGPFSRVRKGGRRGGTPARVNNPSPELRIMKAKPVPPARLIGCAASRASDEIQCFQPAYDASRECAAGARVGSRATPRQRECPIPGQNLVAVAGTAERPLIPLSVAVRIRSTIRGLWTDAAALHRPAFARAGGQNCGGFRRAGRSDPPGRGRGCSRRLPGMHTSFSMSAVLNLTRRTSRREK